MTPRRLELVALPKIPAVERGDDVAGLVLDGLRRLRRRLKSGDVVVIAQKIVSKAEGRTVDLATVTPSARAKALARKSDKDPRVVELILAESSEVLRVRKGLIVVAHRQGFVLANAGIDQSNVVADGTERALLLPRDPDASCRRLRKQLKVKTGADIAVIINDSVGRAWRLGTVGTALGAAGLPSLLDLRGKPDLFGRILRVTQVGLADQIASAAALVQGEAGEGMPIVLVRGFRRFAADQAAAALIRPKVEDLFR